MLTTSLIGLTFLISATSTGFLILSRLEIKQERELEQEGLRLDSENLKRKNLLVKQKLLRFNIFLRAMESDFTLIFPTINWLAKMSYDGFYSKYRTLWDKVSEVQMIADFYAPAIKELVEELDELTICYWRCLQKMLVTEKNIDRSSPDCLEVEKYSQLVPSKINDIREKIRKIGH